MKVKSIVQVGLVVTTLSTVICFAAEPYPPVEAPAPKTPVKEILIKPHNKIEVPEDHAIIAQNEQNFTFDWNKYATIPDNQKKIAAIEKDLEKIQKFSNLTKPEQIALGNLLYKMGTYYTHIAREPDLAIAKMNAADPLLDSKEAKAWNDNHLAYAYEQKYAHERQAADKEKALTYSNKVIIELFPNEKNKTVAFAYCIQGLVLDEAQEEAEAEAYLRNALSIYEAIPNSKDDQYARVKNRLAVIILNQTGRAQEALAMLQDLKQYWQARGDQTANPYAARNLVVLGQAHLKMNDAKDAQEDFKKAIAIYEHVYGTQNKLLERPYQLLAKAYKQAGSKPLAEASEQKADKLHNG